MGSKKILGLDLGTNSIGWALVNMDYDNKTGHIEGMGSRIIPMGQELSKFEQGQAQTKNASRRLARGLRKLNKRYKQRRNKLIYVLQQLDMLPDQFRLSKSFDNPLHLDKVSILPIAKNQKQFTALDLIELRVKALHEPISLKEMGRLIYLFNQLRGYAGGGNEPEVEDDKNEDDVTEKADKAGKSSSIVFGRIVAISSPELVKVGKREMKKCTITFETEEGIIEGDSFLDILKVGESMELMVNVTTSKKHGESILFKLPVKSNWRKDMENLEKKLSMLSQEHGREFYLCEYFQEKLKDDKWTRIRNNVVLRSRYQSEFDRIWKVQSEHQDGAIHKVLQGLNESRLSEFLNFIFPGTKDSQLRYRKDGMEKGLNHVIRNQIIYYQRELKDQSHLVSDCQFEQGEKAIAKSHPVFQEFKIWEQINKLTINTKIEDGKNRKGEVRFKYVDHPIPSEVKEWLFDSLQAKREIGFSAIYNKLKKDYGLREGTDFLNGMNPKAKLKGDDTKVVLLKALGLELWNLLGLDEKARQIELWHILYNAKGNEYDLESERTSKVVSFIKKHNFQIEDIDQKAILISKIRFPRNYASLSLKAIEKILSLVRCGKYFSSDFSQELKQTIIRLLNETVSDPFEKAAQAYLENNIDLMVDGGVMNAYATILVYGKHTAKEYQSNELIDSFHKIQRLKQGELRNPLVEQLISEALMVVKDIWKQYGKPDEIRLELARELKNNAERRAKIYKSNSSNQKVNAEVKAMLLELQQEATLANIEKYKLWHSQENLSDEFLKQYQDPSKSEIEKLKLWREQGHISPYTGRPIPLSELFNKGLYDIDHIIPQSRYFDDSFNNKVICEKAINLEKSNRTAMEYFEIGSTNSTVFSKVEFIDHVNKRFSGPKRNNLLATKVPEDPVARQMKETQYISLRVKEEMNKIVGNGNVKTTTGGVTDYLRNQWGLTDKFKGILRPRYENCRDIVAQVEYDGYKDDFAKRKKECEQKGIPFFEKELTEAQYLQKFNLEYITKKNNRLIIKGWSKRIDHRHHAMDALVIACTESSHIKRLNDLNKELQTWLDQNRKELLPGFEGSPNELLDEILNLEESKRHSIFRQIEKFRAIEMPWRGFADDAEEELKKIVVSLKAKNKLRIQLEERKDTEGRLVKTKNLQMKLRGPLHEETLYGKTNGVEAYRVPLEKFAVKKFATEKAISKIVNQDLMVFIGEHLKDYDGKKEEAFSAEGIISLNKKLAERKAKNGQPRPHKPISSIKIFYRDPSKAKKKADSEEIEEALQRLNRSKAFNQSLYVKTGDNYLFAVLEKGGRRVFDILSLFDAANLLKEDFNKANDKHKLDLEKTFKDYFELKHKATLLFTLKQGDPIYFPGVGEEVIIDPESPLFDAFWGDVEQRSKNLHYVTKFSGSRIYFLKHDIADSILRGKEFGTQNAYEIIEGRSIKNYCIKIEIDRLGNISMQGKKKSRSQCELDFKESQVNEVAVSYSGNKDIRISASFEDAENDRVAYAASLTPDQRMQEFFALMNRFYQFSKPDWSTKKIIIDL